MNKLILLIGLILSIFVSLLISYLYFQIFIYYFPKNLGPGTYDAAAITYYGLGFSLGILYFLLVAGYIKISGLFRKKEQPKTADKPESQAPKS